VEPRQCRGAQQEGGRLNLCNLSSVEWLESDLKHDGADVLHKRSGAHADIEAGEIVIELKPGGGDLKDETAKPTTLDVENLRGNIVLGLKLLGEPYIGPTAEIYMDWRIILISSPSFGERQVC